MRSLILAVAVAIGATMFAANSQAQQPIQMQQGATWFTPTPFYVPPQGMIQTYRSPYRYQQTIRSGVVPNPFGATTYYRNNITVRPYSQGPFHSVYYDPFARTYRYTTGPRNSVNQSFRIGR